MNMQMRFFQVHAQYCFLFQMKTVDQQESPSSKIIKTSIFIDLSYNYRRSPIRKFGYLFCTSFIASDTDSMSEIFIYFY